MEENVLEIDKLDKHYKSVHALKAFTYRFSDGVYGLLGPNGAGKSTLMNLITDNLREDSGEIRWNNQPVRNMGMSYLKLIGYMPQQQNLFRNMTGNRFLYYMASLKGLTAGEADEQIPKLLKMVNLSDVGDAKMGSYSGGMRQRILIAQALLGDPKILVMDEPTAGLDPKERIRIRNIISEVSFQRIVIVATHVVSDVEFIAKEILMMKKGVLAEHGAPEELFHLVDGKLFEIETDTEGMKQLEKQYRIANLSKEYDKVFVRAIGESAPEGYRYTCPKANLEDVYLYRFDEDSAAGD